MWSSALAAAVVLTAGQFTLPRWQIHVLPTADGAPGMAVDNLEPTAGGLPPDAASSEDVARGAEAVGSGAGSTPLPQTRLAESRLAESPLASGILAGWEIAYVLGMIMWLVLLIGAHVRVASRVRNARPVCSDVAATAHRLAREIGLRRAVSVLESRHCDVPFTWGLRRSVVVVPATAHQWSATTWRSVLLHEFAHVKRHDGAMRTLAEIACAVHWINPLVWMAADRARQESERACDQFVIRHGVRRSTYAKELLSQFRDGRARRLGRRIASIASRRGLARRIESLGDPVVEQARWSPTIPDATRAFALVLAVSIPLSAMTPVRRTDALVGAAASARPSALLVPPHHAGWIRQGERGAIFLDGSIDLHPDGEVSGNGFVLLVATNDLGERAVLHATASRHFSAARVATGTRWRSMSTGDSVWVRKQFSHAALNLDQSATRIRWADQSIELLSVASDPGAQKGSNKRGFPAFSFDLERDVVQAGWMEAGRRFGVVGQLKPGTPLEEIDARLNFVWFVGFSWDPAAGTLVTVTIGPDGEGPSSAIQNGTPLDPAKAAVLHAHLLGGLGALARSQWAVRHGGT